MKKYSKELLASMISDMITFEDCTEHTFDNEVFEFYNCNVIVSGLAYSRERLSGGLILNVIDLQSIVIYFEDGEETVYNVDEIKEIESLVRLWNVG